MTEMERIHAPLTKPLTAGTAVKTDRGYGMIVGRFRGDDHSGYRFPALLIIELDGDGARFVTTAAKIQVIEAEAEVEA